MQIRVRTIILALFVLVVGGILAAITAVGWQVVLGPDARPVTDRKFDPSPARFERGKYIVENVAACFHCHSEHDFSKPGYPITPGRTGAGWVMPIAELNNIASRNITQDSETGLGTWTDDEMARAIREGVSRDGSALFPVMPYLNFARMDDEDLASVVVYLRSIKPVRNVVPKRSLPGPLEYLVKTMPKPVAAPVTHPATTAVERGAYLANLASCVDCHTPADDQGQLLPGLEFSGGGIFHDPGQNGKALFSRNITPDASGIAHFDEAFFIQTIRTQSVPGRALNGIMPASHFAGMTDADLSDIWAFLKSRPAVKHRVSNEDPPTLCPLCKQTHGLGELNVAPGK